MVHLYELAGPGNTFFSITIVTIGSSNQDNHDTLDAAVRNTLVVLKKSPPEAEPPPCGERIPSIPWIIVMPAGNAVF
jgi:hypothetical protein